ncbi:hypothetical protein [Kitasatospora sp. NPDC058190]|uniref:hypothetical protein n=1 Tax=Kitasatospora sp. NPDC058190 TaxID=3346371 RepID=UPI0036D8F517
MAMRIFETDPESKPKPRFVDDTVGRFHSGRSVHNVPESLPEWRITTGDPEVSAAVAQLFGGTPEETDSTSDNYIEVLTRSNAQDLWIASGRNAEGLPSRVIP